jgi:hypothetical protein
MFDRGYADRLPRRRGAGRPALRAARRRRDPAARLAALRADRVTCEAASGSRSRASARSRASTAGSTPPMSATASMSFAAGAARSTSPRGWAAMTARLRLGLRSLAADREVEGEVSIATTGAGDPAAFARVQAGTLDPQRALAEAYRRNNAGSYAESSEYFAALSRARPAPAAGRGAGQRGAAEIQSRPPRRGRHAVRARARSWPAPIR